MPKYEHVLPKQQGGAFSADPPQDISNASGGLLDKELNVQTAVVTGSAIMNGKKLVTTGFNAYIQQSDNAQLEKYKEIGTTLFKYGTLALASGPYAPLVVGVTAAVDISVMAIENINENDKARLQNMRIVEERGVRRKFGVSDIYD